MHKHPRCVLNLKKLYSLKIKHLWGVNDDVNTPHVHTDVSNPSLNSDHSFGQLIITMADLAACVELCLLQLLNLKSREINNKKS